MRLQDKSALVTGAGRGIGRAIAIRLAREGADVTVNDIDESSAGDVSAEIEVLGRMSQVVIADVSDPAQVEDMVQRHIDTFGGIDILVNNAGIVVVRGMFGHSEEDWDRLLAVNLKSVYFCCKSAAPVMIAQKSGKIINTASMAAIVSHPVHAAYCASKAGVVNLTQSLAKELAQHNVQVNAVCPGIIDTEMWTLVDREASEVLGITGDKGYMASRIEFIGMKRAGTPDEVAATYAFLASSDSDYITGEVFKVRGGA